MYSNKKVISDEGLIGMIKKGDESALDYIYKKNYVMIINLILKKGGTEELARDIFQDSLIVFWQKVMSGNFVLRSKISTYLYSICRNLWLKELKKNLKFTNEDKFKSTIGIKEDLNEQADIIHLCMKELSETCKKVLQYYYFDGMSIKQICELLKFANTNTTKTKKYKCKKKLDGIIRSKYSPSDFQD